MAALRPNLTMRAWGALTWAANPLWKRHLQKRVTRGKEDGTRWREKLGEASIVRPKGTLVWLHAVGLGEALALRGLVIKLNALQPTWRFLITSGTLASAQVLADNLPSNCMHQFLPIDTPQAGNRFLDHWRPDMAIWAEQELWPGLVWQTDRRGIPLILVNARMNAASFQKREKLRPLYADALARFALVSAQDSETAQHLTALGAHKVRVDGSIKPLAPRLNDAGLDQVAAQVGARFVWVAASTHPADEVIALSAHRNLLKDRPDAVLIIAPRDVARGPQIVQDAKAIGLKAVLRSDTQDFATPVYVADSFGALGVWYRLASVALIGGTFDATQGHNPWEAAQLSTHILFGPQTANFRTDFEDLLAAGGASRVEDEVDVTRALLAEDHTPFSLAALDTVQQKGKDFDALNLKIIDLLEGRHV